MIALTVAILIAGPISAQDYEPLTPSQARDYWRSLSPEQLDQEIINLDLLENSHLELHEYAVRAFVVDNDVIVQIVGTDGSEAVLAGVGYLRYSITFPESKIENVIPPDKPLGNKLLTGVVIFLAGGLAGVLIAN